MSDVCISDYSLCSPYVSSRIRKNRRRMYLRRKNGRQHRGGKEREQEAKNKASRRENFKKRKWKTSRNGNSYIKVKDHIVVLYRRKTDNVWKYSIDNVFCVEIFETKEEAQMAAFEALDALLNK